MLEDCLLGSGYTSLRVPVSLHPVAVIPSDSLQSSVSVFAGIVATYVLPDFPETWKALSPEMKAVGELLPLTRV